MKFQILSLWKDRIRPRSTVFGKQPADLDAQLSSPVCDASANAFGCCRLDSGSRNRRVSLSLVFLSGLHRLF